MNSLLIVSLLVLGVSSQIDDNQPELQRTFFGIIGSAKAKACSTNLECGNKGICVDGECLVDNGLGGYCSTSTQCPTGYQCIDGKCKTKRHFLAPPCVAECPPGTRCINGVCTGIDNKFY
ncbi:DUF7107 domain-containing protein [Caenorhabditis elegans]|uniref:DUF7107 domain-containing protein n=1 Tax=Caenorhabditis elegans TaxID=6239 RepID=A3FPK1_CAEEL|nr:EB domain-containing protein [Caenorhabditis elegans]CAM33498.1 EB domain-containing protein [Caenorhabditis elegans]|eukprot:NP_001122675.1 Uncharacterized protein CELE_C05B5.11 [Caenorhabditis elegans]